MRAYLSRTSAPTPVLIRAANGFQIILGKVRPNTSPGREPSTSSDHCSDEESRDLKGLDRGGRQCRQRGCNRSTRNPNTQVRAQMSHEISAHPVGGASNQ